MPPTRCCGPVTSSAGTAATGMYVKRLTDGPSYTCQTANRQPDGPCRYHSIKASELAAAVWARVQWVLTDPGVVEIVHGKRRQADHSAEDAYGVDRRLGGASGKRPTSPAPSPVGSRVRPSTPSSPRWTTSGASAPSSGSGLGWAKSTSSGSV